MNTVKRGIAVLLVMLGSVHVQADGGWWERGKALLRGGGGDAPAAALSQSEIAGGLREALRVGTDNVVSRLGRSGGFSDDPKVRIPLPDKLGKVRDVLNKVGMGDKLDDLELRMNRAAEAATPRARDLFVDAIGQMSMDDVRAIYEGPADAATRYFQDKMSAPLAEEMAPIVDQTLAEAGAVRSYDQIMDRYRKVPFVPDVKADLTRHVVDRGIAGIFDYLAVEEAAIRADPVKRTTDLLKKVFGAGS